LLQPRLYPATSRYCCVTLRSPAVCLYTRILPCRCDAFCIFYTAAVYRCYLVCCVDYTQLPRPGSPVHRCLPGYRAHSCVRFICFNFDFPAAFRYRYHALVATRFVNPAVTLFTVVTVDYVCSAAVFVIRVLYRLHTATFYVLDLLFVTLIAAFGSFLCTFDLRSPHTLLIFPRLPPAPRARCVRRRITRLRYWFWIAYLAYVTCLQLPRFTDGSRCLHTDYTDFTLVLVCVYFSSCLPARCGYACRTVGFAATPGGSALLTCYHTRLTFHTCLPGWLPVHRLLILDRSRCLDSPFTTDYARDTVTAWITVLPLLPFTYLRSFATAAFSLRILFGLLLRIPQVRCRTPIRYTYTDIWFCGCRLYGYVCYAVCHLLCVLPRSTHIAVLPSPDAVIRLLPTRLSLRGLRRAAVGLHALIAATRLLRFTHD